MRSILKNHEVCDPIMLLLRVYTYQFGQNLIEAMMWHRPRPTMRHKVKVPPRATDLELFESLPLHDLWDDAKLVQVYQYLRNGISTIPNTWESAISMFDAELVSLGFQI